MKLRVWPRQSGALATLPVSRVQVGPADTVLDVATGKPTWNWVF
jgi:hypothetical protein